MTMVCMYLYIYKNTHVYLWRIHFDIWQNQYNYVKFKNKIKKKTHMYKCLHILILELFSFLHYRKHHSFMDIL